jgi:hypothetical protein
MPPLDPLLLLLLFAVQFGLVVASPHSRVVDWINACRIDDWTSECVPAPRRALPWCVDPLTRDRISALMRTMQTHHPAGARVVPATCFGTNVQLYYMPRRDEFLLNPVVTRRGEDTKWYECKGVRRPHHTALTVRFLNSYFNEQVAEFVNMDALALECELEEGG